MKRHTEIEQDLRKKFLGWDGEFTYNETDWYLDTDPHATRDFYDLYPTSSKAEADLQIIKDIMEIINKHLPGFTLSDYEQHGKVIVVE